MSKHILYYITFVCSPWRLVDIYIYIHLLNIFQTNKKKYFVLRSTSSSGPARLEYYDSEKKLRLGQPPKRSLKLHTCFNINKKNDTRQKYAIALYTKDECFSVLADDAVEQELWLNLLLKLQNEFIPAGEMPKPHYGKSLDIQFSIRKNAQTTLW